jgi:hypothetical protein
MMLGSPAKIHARNARLHARGAAAGLRMAREYACKPAILQTMVAQENARLAQAEAAAAGLPMKRYDQLFRAVVRFGHYIVGECVR